MIILQKNISTVVKNVVKGKSTLENLYKTEPGRWGLSLIFTFIIFIIVGIFFDRVFFINDDENMLYTFAGYYTGGKPFEHVFVNYVLGGFYRLLYTLIPSMPWYGIYHVVVLFLSIVIINKTILKECQKYKISLWKSLLLCVILYFVLFIYPTVLMQFTTTATFAGMAAVVLVLGKDWGRDSRMVQIADSIISTLFILLCYMHRYNTGYVLLCFFGGTVLYQCCKLLFSKDKSIRNNLYRLFMQVGMVIIGLICVVSINNFKRDTIGWDYFKEYDSARFKVTDYPHDTFEQNPELYVSLGWSEELYNLVCNGWWFFMDENVNATSFKAIADTGYYNKENVDIKQIINVASQLFENDQIARVTLSFVILIIFYGVVLFIKDENKIRNLWEHLFNFCMTSGMLILCTYLCFKQRFPLRAFHTITLPFIAITVINLISIRSSVTADNLRRKESFLQKIFLGGILILIAISIMINFEVIDTQSKTRIAKSQRTLQLEEYAIDHPDNFYIYDTSLTFRYLPFTVYTEYYPSNVMFWGGMGWNSPAFFRQLELNNLTSMYSDVFLKDNVYYVTWDDYLVNGKTMRERFLDYMISKFPGIKIELVETIGNNINVYKFSY